MKIKEAKIACPGKHCAQNRKAGPSVSRHERRSILRERGPVSPCGYEKFGAAGNEARSQKDRVHVRTATVICSGIPGDLSGRGSACLLLHRQNSIVPGLTTFISRHPRYTGAHRLIHACLRLIARLSTFQVLLAPIVAAIAPPRTLHGTPRRILSIDRTATVLRGGVTQCRVCYDNLSALQIKICSLQRFTESVN